MNLAWIVVADIQKAKEFYQNHVGLTLVEANDQFGWLEFEGSHGGARLGVAQYSPEYSADDKPGMNAIMTMEVDNIQAAKAEMENKGISFIGDIFEVPGDVKMATFKDMDGNKFQLVELVKKSPSAGCC